MVMMAQVMYFAGIFITGIAVGALVQIILLSWSHHRRQKKIVQQFNDLESWINSLVPDDDSDE